MATNIPDNLNLGADDGPSFADKILSKLWLQYRNKMDRYIIYKRERWAFAIVLVIIYLIRVLSYGGFYVVSYILGLYLLQAVVRFLTPLGLPIPEEEEEEKVGEELPMFNQSRGDSKPLIRSIVLKNERQGITGALLLANLAISSQAFDLPVYWPFLFGYFLFLVAMTAKKQLQHMNKYGYSIFDFGKKSTK